jgi:hypothetical protein
LGADAEMKQNALIAWGTAGLIALTVGGRIYYTEAARAHMNDYNDKVDKIFKDAALKAEWSRKNEIIDAKYREEDAARGDCKFSEQEKTEYKINLRNMGQLPHWADVNVKNHCFIRKEDVREDAEINRQLDKEALGTYEEWAYKQSGIDKTHIWLKYPLELRERIIKGERGLMLGKFWEYIL